MNDFNGGMTATIGLFKEGIPEYQWSHGGFFLKQSGEVGMILKA